MTNKTIKQIEHMTLFAEITIEQRITTQETFFICVAKFNDGNQVLATGYNVQSAIDLLNTNMQWYVNNC